jgi:hypothetical protein
LRESAIRNRPVKTRIRVPSPSKADDEATDIAGFSATGYIGEEMQSVAVDLGEAGQRITVLLIACIAFLAILGAVHDATQGLHAFDLDSEENVPAIFSGMLLFVASGLAFLVARRTERIPWLALGALFAFMAVDELAAIHEKLGDWIGVPWLVPYAPLIIAAGAFWLLALRRISPFRSEQTLWLGGALAWICAQGLEAVWIAVGSDSGPTAELSVPEEILEMTGSSMFLLTLYLVSRRLATERASSGRHHAGA